MNKNEFLKAIADKTGLTIAESGKAYEAIFELIADELANGNKVTISGFGVFDVKCKAAREGRNPATNEKITIPASKAASFKVSKALKDYVNK